MFNYRVIAVIKRELREKVLSKTFIFMTILLPVLMFGIIGIQGVLVQYEGDKNTILKIISESPVLISSLDSAFSRSESIKESKYNITFESMPREEFENYLEEKRPDLLNEKINGIAFIPEAALTNKKIEYYSKTPKTYAVTEKIAGPINMVLIGNYFGDKDISEDELRYARTGIDIKPFKVSEEEAVEDESIGNMILAYLFSFLLYISLLMMGSMTMQSVIDEKNNRIVEILLSSVHSRELLTGKILGAAITGVLQMTIWLLPVLAVISTTWFTLPPEITMSINPLLLLYFLFNFFVGLVTFLGLFATVGSIFENSQEAQSGMWPILLTIMIPFFIALSMGKNPNNPIVEVASLVPLASIIIMPAKLTLTDVAVWKVVLSVIINLATIAAIFPLAGKIYRVGILRTGKKPKWSEVVKWLKYKY